MMGYYGGYGLAGGFGWLWMLVEVVFWVSLIALVVWGVSAALTRRGDDGRGSALELLRRRYAAGEITETEFEQARRALA